MPSYEYDKDYPFAAYITNLGKYNEGYLVGEWVKFPTTAEELKNVFQRIGIGSTDDFGAPYEEWFISDYDCYVDGLYDKRGEYANLDELNYLASKLDDMQQYEYDTFQAAMELGDHTGSIRDLINLTENLDCYDVYHGVTDHDDLGRYYIEELGAMEIPEHLENYIDYEAYGRDIALSENGAFTDSGYVYENGGRFMEVYDGSRDSIPEEYRIMGEAQDLLEEKKEIDDFSDIDPAAIRAALENPDKSHIDEMIAQAVQAEREYVAEINGQAPPEPANNTFSIYQLKDGDETRNLRFEGLDAIRRNGLTVDPANYELVYTAPLTPADTLETIFFEFNAARPQQFTGHSLSVSDVIVLQEYGKETAHYCDRFGFSEVPEFLDPARAKEVTIPTPDERATTERITTPRGSFRVTDMSREQMEAAGYGLHHQSEDGKYLIMGNGKRAFAISAEQQEKESHIRTAEMTVEDDYGMIDGIINNGRRGEEQDKAKAETARTEKKPSVMERLNDAKKECAVKAQAKQAAPQKKAPELGEL